MIECIDALEDFFVEVGRQIDFLGQSFVSGFGFPGHRIFERLVLAPEARFDGIAIFSSRVYESLQVVGFRSGGGVGRCVVDRILCQSIGP